MREKVKQFGVVVSVVIIIGASGLAYYYVSDRTSESLSNHATSTTVVSDLNSSITCADIAAIPPPPNLEAAENTALNQLRNSSDYKALTKDRPFQNDPVGCSYIYPDEVAIPDFSFFYSDMGSPYTNGCGYTSYPAYSLGAEIYLVPQGYNLSLTKWSMTYWGPPADNASCTLVTTTSQTTS